MYEILTKSDDRFVAIRTSGKLEKSDFDSMIPLLEDRISRHGKISLYWEMNDFDGWTMEALGADAGFDIKHKNDFNRIAMVGEKKWHEWMTKLMKPFASAELRYFDLSESEEAKGWARTGD